MIHEPHITQRALLTWQRPLGAEGRRDRYPVAELVRAEDGSVSFHYLDAEVIEPAREAGFGGYPGLPAGSPSLGSRALEVLMRRLPPINRPDFTNLLTSHGLPESWNFDSLSLLAYTGARMTSDSFGICETFDGFERPFSYVFDVAGYRHYQDTEQPLELNEPVNIVHDISNEFDTEAVQVLRMSGDVLGYINRLQASRIRHWISEGNITASVFRANGRSEYPRLFILAEFGIPSR